MSTIYVHRVTLVVEAEAATAREAEDWLTTILTEADDGICVFSAQAVSSRQETS